MDIFLGALKMQPLFFSFLGSSKAYLNFCEIGGELGSFRFVRGGLVQGVVSEELVIFIGLGLSF